MLLRDGRYYSRLVISLIARPFLEGKTELRTPLGADYKLAVKAHYVAIADMMLAITQAEQKAVMTGATVAQPAKYRLTVNQIAQINYQDRLTQDQLGRLTPFYAQVDIDDLVVRQLRAGLSGKASDQELSDLVGHRIKHFVDQGYTDTKVGSVGWRTLAMGLCASEYEALERVYERDDGNFSGEPVHPTIANVEPIVMPTPPESLSKLFDDYIATRKILGRGYGSEKRWSPVFKSLVKHLGHDDARRLTKRDLMAWRDKLLQIPLTPKTVGDVYLAAIRAVLKWAVKEDRIDEDVSVDVQQEVPKKIWSREKGFVDSEAIKIIAASRSYRPNKEENGRVREYPETTEAKRWVPLLCAFTGARVSEMTQLRGKDMRNEAGTWVIRITPEAGTVKTKKYRDVPLHLQVIELGFVDFVKRSGSGPLFYRSASENGNKEQAQATSGTISEWLQSEGLIPKELAPSHSWRHRFKTLARDHGSAEFVVNTICGHEGGTEGDNYGDVSIKARKLVIDKMPRFEFAPEPVEGPT